MSKDFIKPRFLIERLKKIINKHNVLLTKVSYVRYKTRSHLSEVIFYNTLTLATCILSFLARLRSLQKKLTNLHYVHSRKNCWQKRERNEVMQISENNHNFRLPLKIISGFNCNDKDTFSFVKTTS